MMADLEFKLTGFDEVSRKLRGLAPRLQRKALRSASRKAMNIVRDDARQNAPVETGNLKRRIITRINSRAGRRFGGMVAQVGLRGGSKNYVNSSKNRRLGRVGQSYLHGENAFYWRFIEFGFFNVKAKRFIQAKPFMRPALSKNTEKVTATMARELKIAIEKEI